MYLLYFSSSWFWKCKQISGNKHMGAFSKALSLVRAHLLWNTATLMLILVGALLPLVLLWRTHAACFYCTEVVIPPQKRKWMTSPQTSTPILPTQITLPAPERGSTRTLQSAEGTPRQWWGHQHPSHIAPGMKGTLGWASFLAPLCINNLLEHRLTERYHFPVQCVDQSPGMRRAMSEQEGIVLPSICAFRRAW